jgi:predicted  nucleic acid-binding Zn-ribbon protein
VTKAQEVYERVEALMASGATKADAFKRLAAEYGQPVNSIRGAYYQYARGQSGRQRTRKRETTPTDAVESAKALLEKAIEQIDAEIETAKERAEEAKREYEAMKASASERKQAIKAKIAALDQS